MKTTLIFIILLSAMPALARLGESNVEIRARYGPVEGREDLGTNVWRGHYSFKEYKVTVQFRDNKSEMEALQPIESRTFADDERDALMNAIGGTTDWAKDSTFTFMSDMWISKKDQAVAYVKDEIGGPSLLGVMTHDLALRLDAEQKAKDKAKAGGF